MSWFREARGRDVALTGPILLEKAKCIADQLGVEGFRQSTGWLERFKERHGIIFRKKNVEKSVNTTDSDVESD